MQSKFDKQTAKIRIETLDDLWYLSQIIEKGDFLRGKAYRKIKFSGEGDRTKVEKRPVTLTIIVEKVELDDVLRVNGIIKDDVEDLSKGMHQAINLEEGSDFYLTKKWLHFHKERLKEAEIKQTKILICVLDRENAIIGITRKNGIKVLGRVSGEVQKKDERSVIGKNFFKEVKNLIERQVFENLILASPAFWKDEVYKLLDEKTKKKTTLATCYSSDEQALAEVIKRPEVQTLLKEQRVSKEAFLVDDFLSKLNKAEPVAYGIKEVETAVNLGAVKEVIFTEKLIKTLREKAQYETLEKLLETSEGNGGKAYLISSLNDSGKKIDGLGGIVAVLRYAIKL